MLETIIIVVCAAVCIGAAAYAWWMENGPEKDDSAAAGTNGHAYTRYDRNIKDDISVIKHTNNDNIYQH